MKGCTAGSTRCCAWRAVPDQGAPAAGDVDVLLTTRVTGLDQLAVIGFGVEALMNMIATQFAAGPEDDKTVLRLVPPAGSGLS